MTNLRIDARPEHPTRHNTSALKQRSPRNGILFSRDSGHRNFHPEGEEILYLTDQEAIFLNLVEVSPRRGRRYGQMKPKKLPVVIIGEELKITRPAQRITEITQQLLDEGFQRA